MPLIEKIRNLCRFNGTSVTKLEVEMGFGNGSITKNTTIRSDRVRKIADYFKVTPTYLMTDMKYCVCPVCGVAFDPLEKSEIETHRELHKRYITLREKNGYLLNPSQAATKRSVAEIFINDPDIPDDGKIFHYETLIQCDFAEYAYFNNFQIDIEYSDFIKQELREKKYFDCLSSQLIKNLTVKYGVDLSKDNTPLIDLFQKDKIFMQYITDLWDLPEELRIDVYKAIRHAKRDYADKEYFTNPYASIKEVKP